MDFKKLLNEDVQKILTKESLEAIEQAFNEKVELSVNAALEEQDEIYAGKLKDLITKIDVSHTSKLKKLVEAIDRNNSSKLMKVVKLFKRESGKDAKQFKGQLVESVSNYLDEYLKDVVSREDFSKAIKNENAYKILQKMRGVLAVDSVMMDASIRGAVIDGQSKISEASKQNEQLAQEVKLLKENNEKMKVKMLLEDKTSKLPETKKQFIRKALQDKSYKFIEENFDYTLRLFEKQEKQKLSTLKEEAINKRQVKPDVLPKQEIVQEKVNNTSDNNGDMYVDVLSNSWNPKR